MPFLNYTHQCKDPAYHLQGQQYCKPCTIQNPSEDVCTAPPPPPPGEPDPSVCTASSTGSEPFVPPSQTGCESVVTFGNLSAYGVWTFPPDNNFPCGRVVHSEDAYPDTESSCSMSMTDIQDFLDEWTSNMGQH